ncbi:MAG: 1-deoxy-D-xylulose-5-phosphate reductoisomerase [Oscillospiraceae bacterium]|jgi:1-deoxy-D-xylulose-5-phosphate reductoisomerase|nr:1-deoxy-D-xylulose-5-phosphate reductoisomerase [Oscillospiraceae bacterium]
MEKQQIAILGSTGSIGTQALQVVDAHPDRFSVVALTARHSADALFEQVRRYRPLLAALAEEPKEIPDDLRFCEWVFGDEALRAAAMLPEADAVLVAVVGFAGLPAVLDACNAGKKVLLANKEALVAGGALVTAAARRAGQPLLPVDSEHSAIFQCLQGATGKPSRLILTASGGPFRTWPQEAIERATAREALNHPNWVMGRKITVDSASMINKALEVIEAHWLFDMPGEQIDVLVHPQSIVHSMVEFPDGAVLAQLGLPDMRLPIQYAMAYPERLTTAAPMLDFARINSLTFEPPDTARFPGLSLAYEALSAGGAAGAVLNAANEIAVEAFLDGRMPFGQIARTVRETMERLPALPLHSLDDAREADAMARRIAAQIGID